MSRADAPDPIDIAGPPPKIPDNLRHNHINVSAPAFLRGAGGNHELVNETTGISVAAPGDMEGAAIDAVR